MKPIPTLAFPKLLDNTTISAFAKCPRQFYWGHLLHLKPKNLSIHLHAGKSYAAMLDVFRKSYYTPTASTYRDLEASIVNATRELLRAYGYNEEIEQSEAWAKSPKSALRMLECFLAMLDEYPPATDPIQPLIINGEPAIEKSFSLELDIRHPDTGDPILFHGRFDMLAEYIGQIFVFDDKTTSSLGPQWNNQWEFRSQFTGYCLGAQSFDVPVAGAIVRGHCILKNSFKFAQPITYRKSFMIEQWWQDVHVLAHQMVEAYTRAKNSKDLLTGLESRKYFPTTGTFNEGCNAYAGCEFRELDGSPNPQRWLSNFDIRVWDPLDPDGDKAKAAAQAKVGEIL